MEVGADHRLSSTVIFVSSVGAGHFLPRRPPPNTPPGSPARSCARSSGGLGASAGLRPRPTGCTRSCGARRCGNRRWLRKPWDGRPRLCCGNLMRPAQMRMISPRQRWKQEQLGLVRGAEHPVRLGPFGRDADLYAAVLLALLARVRAVADLHRGALVRDQRRRESCGPGRHRHDLAAVPVVGGGDDEGVRVSCGILPGGFDSLVEGNGLTDLAAGVGIVVLLVDGGSFDLKEEPFPRALACSVSSSAIALRVSASRLGMSSQGPRSETQRCDAVPPTVAGVPVQATGSSFGANRPRTGRPGRTASRSLASVTTR